MVDEVQALVNPHALNGSQELRSALALPQSPCAGPPPPLGSNGFQAEPWRFPNWRESGIRQDILKQV